ncbi:MAG: DeoR family transcriptional regulator [bacterium]|nr:DeoR family transcriptional regulator [bacterium]
MKGPGSRLEKILFLLKKRGNLTTKELSIIFKVSEVTIRNDLNELSRQGLVIRNYGGVTIAEAAKEKPILTKPLTVQPTIADRIGKAAANLVHDGDVIFLDSSPVSKALAEYIIGKESITIFTNSIPLSERMASFGNSNVYLTGGRVNYENRSVIGDYLGALLEHHHLAKAFIGCWGITEKYGLTDASKDEADVKRVFIQKARQVIGLVESSRWGIVSLSSFASIQDLDIVVTDDSTDGQMADSFMKEGVDVVNSPFAMEKPPFLNTPYQYYETMCADAEAEKFYANQPGRKKKIAFANGLASEPFCIDVAESFYKHARLAGFSPEDIFVFDNGYDEEKALKNAESVIALKPDVFVEFQLNAKMNNIIAAKMDFHRIPVLALEIQVPSAPFVGVNNWQAGTIAGDFAADLIRKKFGSIDAIDKIILIQISIGSEINFFRTEGFAASLTTVFGEEIEEKIIREDCSSNTAEAAMESMSNALEKCADCDRLAITTINHEAMSGVIKALKSTGKWEPGRHVLVSHSCDVIGREQIEEGSVDGSVGYFPEHYGSYIMPAACALMSQKAVPPYIYVDTHIITRDNLRLYYPKKE